MIVSVRHVGIVVLDLDVALRFYHGLLGLPIVRQAQESGKALNDMLGLESAKVTTIKLSCGYGCMVELLRFSWPESEFTDREIYDHGISHIALTVTDLDAEYRRLKLSGVRFVGEPVQSDFARVVFAFDPDGNMIELVEELNFPRAA